MAQAQSPEGTPKAATVESAGVEDLIGRLRDQGIAQGRGQAEALVAAAQKQAAEIVAAAKTEAEGVSARATEEAAKLKAAGEDAIRLAMRDAILALEGELTKHLTDRIHRLVKGTLDDPAFLQRLILEVAGRAAPAAAGKAVELLLPVELISLDDLRRKPEEAKPGTLMHFVMSMGDGMLRDGVSLGVRDDGEAGIRVRVVDDDLQIDLTDTAITELLLLHMLPRFRALLRGAVVPAASDAKPPEPAKG